jgi:hypothetical protein
MFSCAIEQVFGFSVRLEIVYSERGRGFESRPLRHEIRDWLRRCEVPNLNMPETVQKIAGPGRFFVGPCGFDWYGFEN